MRRQSGPRHNIHMSGTLRGTMNALDLWQSLPTQHKEIACMLYAKREAEKPARLIAHELFVEPTSVAQVENIIMRKFKISEAHELEPFVAHAEEETRQILVPAAITPERVICIGEL